MAGKAAGKDSKSGQNAGKDAGRGGGPSFGQTAIAFVVGGLIAAGLGGFVGYSTAPPPPAAGAQGAAGAHGAGGAQGPAGANDKAGENGKFEMGVMDLAPVVTNLAAPADVWVRLETSILFEGKILPHGEAMASEITGDFLAYMRTLTLAQIQGVAGLQHLREDLAERAATRSDGKVRGLIIKALVVQ